MKVTDKVTYNTFKAAHLKFKITYCVEEWRNIPGEQVSGCSYK